MRLNIVNILIFFFPVMVSANEYSINLMWVYRNITPSEKFVFIQNYKGLELEDMIRKWAEKNPTAPVNIWFDSQLVTEQQKENSIAKMEEINQGLNRTSSSQIKLKDVRELMDVQNNPEVFSTQLPPHFRSDLLRLDATLAWLRNCEIKCFFVYADFNVEPMSEKELFDEKTIENLYRFGVVFAEGETPGGLENFFHIIGNNNANLLKAINTAVINVNIQRAKNDIKGNIIGSLKKAEMVYNSLQYMFQYFYHLEGYGKLLYEDENGDEVKYSEEIHGLTPFKLRSEPDFDGTFKSKNPLIMVKPEGIRGKAQMQYPLKKVSKPKISGIYH